MDGGGKAGTEMRQAKGLTMSPALAGQRQDDCFHMASLWRLSEASLQSCLRKAEKTGP